MPQTGSGRRDIGLVRNGSKACAALQKAEKHQLARVIHLCQRTPAKRAVLADHGIEAIQTQQPRPVVHQAGNRIGITAQMISAVERAASKSNRHKLHSLAVADDFASRLATASVRAAARKSLCSG